MRERRRISRSEHKTAGAHRPPHPLGPGVVLAVPDVPAAARRPARRAAPPARGRSVLRPLPARRADGGGRRLPRRAPRGRGAAARPRRHRPRWRWGPGTRCPTSSSCRARPSCATCSAGLRVASRFGGAMEVGYLPDMFGHVAQMPQLLRLFGFEHAVVWRGVPVGHRPQRVLVDGARRLHGAGRVPPAGLRQRRPRARRRQGARAPHRRVRGGAGRPAHRPDPLDERHRPPHAPAVARPGGRRGQRPRPRLRAPHLLARRARAPGRPPTDCRRGRASCAPAPAPTCSWAWPRTGST